MPRTQKPGTKVGRVQGPQKEPITRFGVVFCDDKIVIHKPLRQTVIMLLHKGHPAIKANKMNHAARPFWYAKLIKDIQDK